MRATAALGEEGELRVEDGQSVRSQPLVEDLIATGRDDAISAEAEQVASELHRLAIGDRNEFDLLGFEPGQEGLVEDIDLLADGEAPDFIMDLDDAEFYEWAAGEIES